MSVSVCATAGDGCGSWAPNRRMCVSDCLSWQKCVVLRNHRSGKQRRRPPTFQTVTTTCDLLIPLYEERMKGSHVMDELDALCP